jgi:polar amino acid transport system substrate-binding protein
MTIQNANMNAAVKLAQAMLSTLLLLPAAPASADRLADIKAHGKLVVGISDAIPPFTFRRAGGEPAGYDVDLVRGVAERIGVNLEMISIVETERISALQQGKVDLVASTFTRTLERERDVDFSVNMFYSPQVIIVDKASGLTSVKQLAGRTIGVLTGRTADKNILDVIPTAQIVFVASYAGAFSALKEKKLDAFAADNLVLRTNLKKENDAQRYFFVPDFNKGREAGFGIKKGETALKNAVDRALLDMEASGEAPKIFDVWFGPKSDVPIARTFKIHANP